MPLTDKVIKQATPKAKPTKKADGHGLYISIQPNGAKYWRFDYRFAGKRQTLSFGVYPDVSLTAARDQRDTARRQLRAGQNPSTARKLDEARTLSASASTLKGVANEWLDKRTLADRTIYRLRGVFENHLFPALGDRPIAEIEPVDLLPLLHGLEAKGWHETAHRVKQVAGQVFRYAIATGRARRDPVADLKGALAPVKKTHFASLTTPADIGRLMRAIDGFHGSSVVRLALKFAPLVFVRPGELRTAEWAELDLPEKLWRIPGAKMKARQDHVVPLSRQALVILAELAPLTGRGRYVFPSIRRDGRPMSENTLNSALRRLGYEQDEMTAHGFRSMASTRLNEMGFRPDVIERQLAHIDKDQVRAAYNRAEYLSDRVELMQAWADELDRLRENVVALRQQAG